MSWFDAICHAFSAMSLGGFSTHDASVGYFDSPAIEIVLMVFMLIAAMNFATHFLALRSDEPAHLRDDPEAEGDARVIGLSTLGDRAVHLVPTASTTSSGRAAARRLQPRVDRDGRGFVTQDYAIWPVFAPMWMLLLSCYCPAPAPPAAASRCSARCC